MIPVTDKYRLEGTTPVPEPDVLAWARWWEKADRQVALTTFGPLGDEASIMVSTVFLALDHGFGLSRVPILFETMVFWPGGALDHEQERYATHEQAMAGHLAWVERVEAAREPALPQTRCRMCGYCAVCGLRVRVLYS